MKDTAKKAGFLKGLLEGMNYATDSAEGKVIHCIADLLSDLCERVDSLDEVIADLNDYVESIDDDLSALEGDSDGADYRFLDEDEDEDYDDFEDAEDQLHVLRGKDSAAEADEYAAGLCPECGRPFLRAADDMEGTLYDCPHCKKSVLPIPLVPGNVPEASPSEK